MVASKRNVLGREDVIGELSPFSFHATASTQIVGSASQVFSFGDGRFTQASAHVLRATHVTQRDGSYVETFLGRLEASWRAEPDQRFGQFVGNVVRFSHASTGRLRELANVEEINDQEFLLALDEWDEYLPKAREAAERQQREAPGERIDPMFEEGVRQTIAVYDRWALKTFGRIGRDPARIQPFLQSFAQIWLKHVALGFGQLVCSGLPIEPDPDRPERLTRVGLQFLEEDEFLNLLHNPGSRSAHEIYQVYARRGPLGNLLRSFGER